VNVGDIAPKTPGISLSLIVFSGLPGTGKSSLAEATGRALGLPVVSRDRLAATLRRCQITEAHGQGSGWTAYELLTDLAEAQLRLGVSVILDSVATQENVRAAWRALAARHRANFCVIECVCSDEALWRPRITSRRRDIPGWSELGWNDVDQVRRRFEPWTGERLIVDSVEPIEVNLDKILAYLSGGCAGQDSRESVDATSKPCYDINNGVCRAMLAEPHTSHWNYIYLYLAPAPVLLLRGGC
jgi:predicted kinase